MGSIKALANSAGLRIDAQTADGWAGGWADR